jgi:hypothetical protein
MYGKRIKWVKPYISNQSHAFITDAPIDITKTVYNIKKKKDDLNFCEEKVAR